MSSYLMINEKGPKTHIIEYHPSPASQITSFMESSTITNNIHDNNSNNNSLFESFIMKEKKELSSSPIIRLRSPRTTSQRREMTLEEWYKLPEYVQIRVPCPVLLKDIVTPSPLTNKIKRNIELEINQSSPRLLKDKNNNTVNNDILPTPKFVARKKISPKKDIHPSPTKPKWKYTNQSRSTRKVYTKNDMKLFDTLSPRKM